MDNKTEKYRRLTTDVARCKKCDNLFSLDSRTGKKIMLEHDKTRTHINLWSHWQGSLDAEILLIGQDWGRLPEKDKMTAFTSGEVYLSLSGDNRVSESPTDNRLQELFKEGLCIDISKKDNRLFFTNSILCYKTGTLSGKTRAGWFSQCNENYIARLIDIIRPKIIIALGVKAFNALKYCGTLKYKTGDGGRLPGFKVLVEDNNPVTLTLRENGYKTAVFPVYHCGSFSKVNRPYEKQIEDWKRIARHMK